MTNSDFYKFLGEERKRFFEEKVLRWKSKEEILSLYLSGLSPLQIARLFDHEVGLQAFCDVEVVYTKQNGIKKTVALFSKSISLTAFSGRLKEIAAWTDAHKETHLKQPQWKKIRYNHLDKSEEEVIEMVSAQLKNWASNAHNKRRNSGNYSPKYSPEYWREKGYSQEAAIEASRILRNSVSPMRVEFWMKKGFDINESKKIIASQGRAGAHATLSGLNGKHVSLLEKRIFELVSDSNLSQQIFIGPYAYDFGSAALKKLVEVNGTYWHADPRIYEPDDLVVGSKTAKEIWERDNEKISYAQSRGYEVLVVWELDFCKNSNAVIQSIHTFLEK